MQWIIENITVTHLQINLILALNNLWRVDMPLNKPNYLVKQILRSS